MSRMTDRLVKATADGTMYWLLPCVTMTLYGTSGRKPSGAASRHCTKPGSTCRPVHSWSATVMEIGGYTLVAKMRRYESPGTQSSSRKLLTGEQPSRPLMLR
jgi:hypothetical protein